MRRPSLLKSAPKKIVRKTRSEVYLVNVKYMGLEPTYEPGHQLTDNELRDSFNWYNYMEDTNECRDYLIQYLTETEQEDYLKVLKSVKHFPPTLGWISRLLSQGYQVSEIEWDHFKQKLRDLHPDIDETESPETPRERRDNLSQRITDSIADIELRLDSNEKIDLYSLIRTKEWSRNIVIALRDYYQPILNEWEEVLVSKDPQVIEGYKHFTKPQKKERFGVYQGIVDDCDRFLENAKKQRKPRKKKEISSDKILKDFTFKDENIELQLKSIPKEKILTSNEIWLYNDNPNNKTLTRLVAKEGMKLSINRNTFLNFDPDKSKSRRIGRRTKETLDTIVKSARKTCENEFNNIKSETVLQTRSNNTTLVIKAFSY